MVHFGSALAGLGFVNVGQFQVATSVEALSGKVSFSLGMPSLSVSYSMSVALPATNGLPRLSGLVVPPMSASSQSYTPL